MALRFFQKTDTELGQQISPNRNFFESKHNDDDHILLRIMLPIRPVLRKNYRQIKHIPSSRCMQTKDGQPIPAEELMKVKNRQQLVLEKYLPKADPIDEKSLHCIVTRQTLVVTPDIFAVDKERCRYGFPRAFVRYPFSRTWQTGMVRLSCPHLVRAVDKLEADGGVVKFDKILQAKESNPIQVKLKESFLKLNDTWNKILNDLMTDFTRKLAERNFLVLGTYQRFFDSGFIGVGKEDVDKVKCLHAHLADHLVRGDNKIGELVEAELKRKGVSTSGCQGKFRISFTPLFLSYSI